MITALIKQYIGIFLIRETMTSKVHYEQFSKRILDEHFSYPVKLRSNGFWDNTFKICFCSLIRFILILLQARHEELIVWRIDECSLQLWAIYEVLQMGKKKEDSRSISQHLTPIFYTPKMAFHKTLLAFKMTKYGNYTA